MLLLEDEIPLSFLDVQGKLLLGFQFCFLQVAFLLYFTKHFEKTVSIVQVNTLVFHSCETFLCEASVVLSTVQHLLSD